MRVELSAQALAFVRRLAPEPRRMLREALHGLERERGDIQPLEAELRGFFRLRVSRYRVVFHYALVRGQRVIRCEFIEDRSIVYQLMTQMARYLKPEESKHAPPED